MLHLIDAVHYCHQHGVIHHDLKLENCLLFYDTKTRELTVKIADFGLSYSLRQMERHAKWTGTLAYMNPEQVAGISCTGLSIDAWALGVICFAMVTGTLPFRPDAQHTKASLARAIMAAEVVYPDYLTPGTFFPCSCSLWNALLNAIAVPPQTVLIF